MASNNTTSKVGHGLAKALGIKLQYRNPTGEDRITRGESVFSVSTADTYVEEEPTTLDWILQVAPTGRTFIRWAYSLFPFTQWIGRYNGTWLIGDLVAGLSANTEDPRRCSLTWFYRYHCGMRRRSSIHGLCQIGSASGSIWSLFLLYGSFDLLVFCYV